MTTETLKAEKVKTKKYSKSYKENSDILKQCFDKSVAHVNHTMGRVSVLETALEKFSEKDLSLDIIVETLDQIKEQHDQFCNNIKKILLAENVSNDLIMPLNMVLYGILSRIENLNLKIDMSKNNNNRHTEAIETLNTPADADSMPSSTISDARTFGVILKSYRKTAKLSQQELAERADLTRSNVSQLETDSWEPRLNTILKLADALNIEPAALLPKRPARDR